MFLINIVIGTILGVLAGLGTGGGSLLILWLTMALKVDTETARGINLLFFIPSAIIACIFRRKQGAYSVKKIIPAAIAGCITAGIFSWIGSIMDSSLLKKLFGALLLFIGTKEVFYRPKNAK